MARRGYLSTQVWCEIAGPAAKRSSTLLLSYLKNDPWAIHLYFPQGKDSDGKPVRWQLARDLLEHGFKEAIGDGDARIIPDTDYVTLRLSSPEGWAYVKISRPILMDFVKSTFKMVPSQEEYKSVDWEREFSWLHV